MGAIYLIRHGQASATRRNYDQLSRLGVEQSKVLGQSLETRLHQVDQVISGAMKRHHETARHSLRAMGRKLEWDQDQRWNEYDHQELITRLKPAYAIRPVMLADLARTLRPAAAFQEMFEKALDRWVSGEYDHEYRETWPQFRKRVRQGLEDLVSELGRSRTALVYTSGGAISAVVQELWGMPPEQWRRLNRVIANATITKVVYGSSGMHLSTFNEHGHFEGPRRHLLTYR